MHSVSLTVITGNRYKCPKESAYFNMWLFQFCASVFSATDLRCIFCPVKINNKHFIVIK